MYLLYYVYDYYLFQGLKNRVEWITNNFITMKRLKLDDIASSFEKFMIATIRK